MKTNTYKISILILLFIRSLASFAASEVIALDGKFLPAADLLNSKGEILTSEEARKLSNSIDLSTLEPRPNDIWDGKDYLKANEDKITDDKAFSYSGAISSQSGLLRFNVRSKSNERFVISMSKEAHSIMLRKALLQKMGYIVPRLQWLEEIEVSFNNEDEKRAFLDKNVFEATSAVAKRWLVKEEEKKIVLKDVLIYSFAENSFYNLAYGIPPKYTYSRTIRAAGLYYGLTDVTESVNKLSWKMGLKSENRVQFDHFFVTATGADRFDAKWALNKLAKLNRNDFEQIVESAKYPQSVSTLLVEKLISRRNSILKLFEINSKELSFNYTPNFGEELKEGILKKEEFEGYASLFAHGEPDSPFKDLEYYVFSELRGQVIDELMSRVNKKLSFIDVTEAQREWFKKDFKEGLEHYLKTGEFRERSVGTWFSPTADGNVILSRDVVMGSQGQNDNLVQIADTIGASVSLGGHLGIEGLDPGYGAYIKGDVSFLKTYTHMRPLKDLKEAMKSPYSKMLVNFSKMALKKNLFNLSDAKDENERKEIFNKLDNLLGVGESLIITTSITPKVFGKLSYTTMSGTNLGLSAATDHIRVGRIHIYRESRNVMQVYVDKGHGTGWSIGFDVKHLAPILRLSYGGDVGGYSIRYYRVPLAKDEDQSKVDPVRSLALLLQKGHTNGLDEAKTLALTVKNEFADKSFKFALLWWRYKKLTKTGRYAIDIPGKKTSHLIRRGIEKLRGVNLRAFAEDLANYFLIKKEEEFRVRNSPWKNPGHTPFGMSLTDKTIYESNVDRVNGRILEEFMTVRRGKAGWKMKRDKLADHVEELNEQFGFELFTMNDVYDATDLNLYDIEGNIYIYNKGIKNILSLSRKDIDAIERRYLSENEISFRCNEDKNRTIVEDLRCGDFDYFNSRIKKCNRYKNEVRFDSYSECMIDLVDLVAKSLPFSVLYDMAGEGNYYIYGSINGFRKDSEYLNREILSNSEGEIGSRSAFGPFLKLQTTFKVQGAELFGQWIREAL
ncbi:hypothetical protein M899_0271 [Bacteriovorax sp. BSW11_IV]|uniref:hypothetical protein n=1 Tax=Bacteriovorax sp. BSW11_IV TaxID=1353529 RepID=UPI000389E2ED|nr:hypothetical protein [Bacteriovorax sp. BSW11_IV]EQC47642.1 hypothetical protein M899_0271 [Bacteriovorax sp. BSW11_IV]